MISNFAIFCICATIVLVTICICATIDTYIKNKDKED